MRYAEFARAICDRALAEKKPPVRYYGCFREDSSEHQDSLNALKTMAYQRWDQSADAPPRKRTQPNEPAAEPPVQLSLLAWAHGKAAWPNHLLEKFEEGSSQQKVILSIKEEFNKLFPQSTPTATPGSIPRASGSPDFTIDGGKKPIDVLRDVDLQPVSDEEASKNRLLSVFLDFDFLFELYLSFSIQSSSKFIWFFILGEAGLCAWKEWQAQCGGE